MVVNIVVNIVDKEIQHILQQWIIWVQNPIWNYHLLIKEYERNLWNMAHYRLCTKLKVFVMCHSRYVIELFAPQLWLMDWCLTQINNWSWRTRNSACSLYRGWCQCPMTWVYGTSPYSSHYRPYTKWNLMVGWCSMGTFNDPCCILRFTHLGRKKRNAKVDNIPLAHPGPISGLNVAPLIRPCRCSSH